MNIKIVMLVLGIAFVLAGCAKPEQGPVGAKGETVVAAPSCDKDFAEGYQEGYDAARAAELIKPPYDTNYDTGFQAGYQQAVLLCKQHIKKTKHDNH